MIRFIKTLIRMWERLQYFWGWNAFWGAILGMYLGTIIIPVVGTVPGFGLGCFIGFATGIVCGLAAILAHPFIFDRDKSAEDYDISLARLLSPVAGITAASLTVFMGIFLLPDDENFFTVILHLIWLPTGLLAAAANLFIPHGYAARMLKSTAQHAFAPMTLDETSPSAQRLSITKPAELLWQRGMRQGRWIALLCAGIGFYLVVHGSQAPYLTIGHIQALLSAGFVAVMGVCLFWAYCALGNVMVLSFLKKTIYKRYFPMISDHRYRVSLTIISFVFTCLLTWYTLILAPFIAGLAAYHIYHTLALPDDSPEKAKRKEKGTPDKTKHALALDDETQRDNLYESLESQQEGMRS